MIHLVYGLSGTGKSTLIREYIKKDIESGEKVILISPEQQALELEKEMLKLLPSQAQLSFEAVNFTRLANKLFRIYGGLSYNYISRGVKNLLMKRTLMGVSSMLEEYSASALGDSSLPSLMLGQIDEFKIHGISATTLERASHNLDPANPLKSKLSDLSLIYSVYSGMVKNSYDDSEEDLEKLYKILTNNNFFSDYTVYVDSFYGFTHWQYKIIERIFAQSKNCTLTIPSPSPTCNHVYLSTVNEMSAKIRSFTNGKEKTTVLKKNRRTTNEALKRIWEHLWNFKISAKSLMELSENDKKAVEIVECSDPYNESDFVTNAITELIMNGYRRREIAVVAGNMESYRGILDASLEKAEIPFYFSEKTELTSKPVTTLLLSAFAIKLKNWRKEDVMTYLKTGLTDIEQNEIDNFEIYVSTWNIKGNRFFDDFWSMNPDGYSNVLTERGANILGIANKVKKELTDSLSLFHTKLESSKTADDFCQTTYDFIISSKLHEKLKDSARRSYLSNERREAMETSGTLKAIIGALRDISSVMGDEEITEEEFVSLFKLVLENSDIGTIPTAADEVLLGSADMLRAEGIRATIIIGANDGVFPARISDTGILSSTDRNTLEKLGIELSGDTSSKTAEELLHVYRAATLPSDKLIITYNTSSLSGGLSKPSIAVSRIASLIYGDNYAAQKYTLMDESRRTMTKRLSFEAFKSLSDGAFKASLKQVLSEDSDYGDAIKKSELPITEKKCRLSNAATDKIFGNKISTTHSKLESYMNCHFAFYCDNILGIWQNEKAAYNSANAGTFIHRIFEVFVKNTVDENGFNANISKSEIKSIIAREAQIYTEEMFKNDKIPSGRMDYYISYLIRLAEITAENLYDELCDSLFVPKYFEFKIGNSPTDALPSPEITLDNGTKIVLRGTVDRIDVYKSNGDIYIKVIDYKTGDIEFNIDRIKDGYNIQLLLYLFAICNSKSSKAKLLFSRNPDGNLIPASATYISNKISKVDIGFSNGNEDIFNSARKKIKQCGVVLKDTEILSALSRSGNKSVILQNKFQISREDFQNLDREITNVIKMASAEMRSGNADIEPSKSAPCQYCKLKQFCRVKLDNNNIEETEDE